MSDFSACGLCPRACGVDRTAGLRGRCQETATVRIARASLHQWEEPCLSGERGSGTVFFTGCPLGCVFCQNYNIAAGLQGVSNKDIVASLKPTINLLLSCFKYSQHTGIDISSK